MWCERLIYTIDRGIFNLKELERMEMEEAARPSQARPSDPETQQPHLLLNIAESSDSIVKWLLFSDFALFFGLLADLRIFKSVETLPDTRSDS